MSDTNEALAQPTIDDLLRTVLASEEQGEHVDRDAVVREKLHHRNVLIRFFAGQNLKEIAPSSKPGWLRRWIYGIQISFVPFRCLQCLDWMADLIRSQHRDIESFGFVASILLLAAML